ncbi:DUF4091 domain-containing protein [Sphingobacterium sp. FBM7-1]|uniref:DUF4091 domain-containing protein n=1 Tax=Sphingobacterium sp. FBM7-1 TaxID=2886688 RepID=UPI001D123924|nr:DUF4091 domain-containing protein [Sphingobacterium sp. FBM7-1]MCC2599913.1 DUF4091 domain-containing protein [Sphingobacterium sp. FBM7-1]
MDRRTLLKSGLAASVLGLSGISARADEKLEADLKKGNNEYIEKNQLKFWLETSLKRVYPNSLPEGRKSLMFIAAKNEQLSFQVCFRNLATDSAQVKCEIADGNAFNPKVRRVGFVPMQHLNTYVPKDEIEGIGFIPGLCPDPLYPEDSVQVGPESNGVFWITLKVPKDMSIGVHKLTAKVSLINRYGYVGETNPPPFTIELPVEIDVRSLVIQPRKDFPVTHWISADSIWEWYKIKPVGERFWELAEQYIANIVAHNVNVVYTPIFNARHEILRTPAQLLKIKKTGKDKYVFDFSDVRKWVRLAVKHGAEYVEWTHFFTPAPTSGKHPQRIFERNDDKIGEMLWAPEISAMSDTYRKFLEQFLPQFKQFLIDENVLEMSLFHCADEPDGEAQIADYRKARGLLKELAPWMKVMDAMSDPHFAVERLSDMPVPSITTAPAFAAAGCPAWVYYCCGPRDQYLQRLLDTPLSKIRMSGLLFYKLDAKGFLHWGHNYWFIFCTPDIGDPFTQADVKAWPGLPYGDAFVVYPGPEGPLDSIRYEVFAESLQDFALLQSAGIKQDDPMFDEIKDYANFPKSAEWFNKVRRAILERY